VLAIVALTEQALSQVLEDAPTWDSTDPAMPGTLGTAPEAVPCAWPECMPRCIPCRAREVGTCKLGMMTSFFGCSSSRGPTDCILGKCLCKNMYCASADGEHCVPQVCLPGASPPPYEPSWWVRLFYSMGGIEHFPVPLDLQAHKMDYAWILARPSLALVELGVFIATCTLVCVWCCRGFGIMHLKIGDKGSPVPLRQRLADGGSTDPEEDGGRSPTLRGDGFDAPSKPWACPLLCMVLFILAFNWLAIKIRHRGFSRDVAVMGEQFDRAYADISDVATQAQIINQTCANFKDHVLQVPLSCKVDDPLTRALIKKGVSMADDAMANYVQQVKHLYLSVKRLPMIMDVIRYIFVNYSKVIIWTPLVPMLLVSVICLLLLVEAIAARCFNSSMLADCVDCGLKAAALLFFVIMVVVAVIAAAEIGACVVASVFCRHVDENSLAYIQMAVGGNETDPYSDAYNASRFYVRGDMYNPIVGYAEAADKYIGQVVVIYQDLEKQIKMVGHLCPGINDINVELIGNQAETILKEVRRILNGTNVWPYYDGIVREGVCKRVVASLGWIAFFQISMGLICFPLCIVVAHFFLARFAAWKHFVDDDRGSSDSEADSDEDDEDITPKGDEDEIDKDSVQLDAAKVQSNARKVAPTEESNGGNQQQDYGPPQSQSRTDKNGSGPARYG